MPSRYNRGPPEPIVASHYPQNLMINTSPLIRFAFTIRTRDGATVRKILIVSDSAENAKEKLEMMYPYCQIMETWHEGQPKGTLGSTSGRVTFENVADLLSQSEEGSSD